jgi:type III restriction enzyme
MSEIKLQFDPNQRHQTEAIDAVISLFDGQARREVSLSPIRSGGGADLWAGSGIDQAAGNDPYLLGGALKENLRAVQEKYEVDVANTNAEIEGWEIFDEPLDQSRLVPHFTIEMETGTGKTYVYLRTIFELSQKYGLQKFVIVVPSIAIREGVLASLSSMREHFRALYNNVEYEHFVYDSKRLNRIRPFAESRMLQIMVINIDAFNKDVDEERGKGSVILRENDSLGGRRPIEFIQAARPVVIIDEPQSVDNTPKAQAAIKKLNPLMTLRYSATHRAEYNLVYRLDPVKAYEKRLVKQIIVASVVAENAADFGYLKVEGIERGANIQAKVKLFVNATGGAKEKSIKVALGEDLFLKSKERAEYKDGFQIAEITADGSGGGYIKLSSGRQLFVGDEIGGVQADTARVQIKETVNAHLKKAVQVESRGIKVLSLFFIDKVSNYRESGDDANPIVGPYFTAIEAELKEQLATAEFASLSWAMADVRTLHGGYFSGDPKKGYKDTSGATAEDSGTYELIMKSKEKLLNLENPLRFIFSHSALREGWDNPNVFQICTLNATASAMKKRQEIGRGLRLPVNQQGERIFDDSINKLHVVANESYESFARALQNEYQEDCGVTFGRVPKQRFWRLERPTGPGGEPEKIGEQLGEIIRSAMVTHNIMDGDGFLLPGFTPRKPEFKLPMPAEFEDLHDATMRMLEGFELERHVGNSRKLVTNHIRKEILMSPEFKALWDRIKIRTTYSVAFDSQLLITEMAKCIKALPPVKPPRIAVIIRGANPVGGGVKGKVISERVEDTAYAQRDIPDLLGMIAEATRLTRVTIFQILKQSGRLTDVFKNSREFMEMVIAELNAALNNRIVEGIQYEQIPAGTADSSWDMSLFVDEESIDANYATTAKKSLYEYVPFDSKVEEQFARDLDNIDEVRYFTKLPRWFEIETPVGRYRPDWAIIKTNGDVVYFIRETKSDTDPRTKRDSERSKFLAGIAHFRAIHVDFDWTNKASQISPNVHS